MGTKTTITGDEDCLSRVPGVMVQPAHFPVDGAAYDCKCGPVQIACGTYS